jgi:hypothetical protein
VAYTDWHRAVGDNVELLHVKLKWAVSRPPPTATCAPSPVTRDEPNGAKALSTMAAADLCTRSIGCDLG